MIIKFNVVDIVIIASVLLLDTYQLSLILLQTSK